VCAVAHADWVTAETWSTPGDIAGWLQYPTDEMTMYQDSGTLRWEFSPTLGMGYIMADAGSSGGAFVGDISGTGADHYAFDFRPDPGVTVNQLYVYVDSLSSTWYEALPLPPDGEWTHYQLMFDTLPGHWIHQMGPESLAETLSHVELLTLEIGTDSGGGGRVDNFEYGVTPEPATVALFGGGLALSALRRVRRRRVRATR